MQRLRVFGVILMILGLTISALAVPPDNDPEAPEAPQIDSDHSQPTWLIPLTTRLRIFMPRADGFKIDGVRVNEWRRTWEAMFAIRPMFDFAGGNWRIMTGGDYHVGTTGSYTLESHSFSTTGGHLGVGLLRKFETTNVEWWAGVLIQRHMQFAIDLPAGADNAEIEAIVEAYKTANPGSRMLYYNEYGVAVFFEGGDRRGDDANWKGEVFIWSPFEVPVIHVIPEIGSGQDIHVAIALFVIEGQDLDLPLLGKSTLKLDWTIHAPGGEFEKSVVFGDGTGGLTYRKKLTHLNPAGSFWMEAGFKQEIDPTGFFRNRQLFAGLRIDGMFFK